MASDFLDANVLIYAWDVRDPRKQRLAQDLLEEAVGQEMTISSQVLAEFSAFLLHRRSPRATAEQMERALASFAPLRLVKPDEALVARAVDAHYRYGIHFYDGMIVAAAERGGCTRIYSEDLNSGQKYFGIEVVNPFQ
jgi:predicted nucleic acid-binding protein